MNLEHNEKRVGAAFCRKSLLKYSVGKWQLMLLLMPALIYVLVFSYGPMYGIIIAFKNFKPHMGIWDSPWVGFANFERFFASPVFWRLIKNTLVVSIYSLLVGFPIPIIFAIMMNSVKNQRFKKCVQTITYAPHFISIVVIVGMLKMFLSPDIGLVNVIIKKLGGDSIFFMGEPGWFSHLYVWSGIWQNIGWSAIIYMASLAGIDPTYYEAATIDGATKMQRIWNIDIPSILPTITIMFIMNIGKVMSVGYEKVFLLQTDLNIQASEVISTYVYKMGLADSQYSFSTAIGLFNSLINIAMLLVFNKLAKQVGSSGIW